MVGRTNEPKQRGQSRPSGTSAFVSRVPTGMGHIPYKSQAAVPGPGAFVVGSGSRKQASVEDHHFGPQNFGSTTTRIGWQRDPVQPFFDPTNQDNPGPVAYRVLCSFKLLIVCDAADQWHAL